MDDVDNSEAYLLTAPDPTTEGYWTADLVKKRRLSLTGVAQLLIKLLQFRWQARPWVGMAQRQFDKLYGGAGVSCPTPDVWRNAFQTLNETERCRDNFHVHFHKAAW